MAKIDITYERPTINTSNKPVAFSGIDYPLRNLEHRDFEKLIYSLYDQEILNKRIPFDDIMLMGGIRDKAQDCALFNNRIKTGIIQCKHSENDTKPGLALCIKEVIKFILYSIADNTLIPDINSFRYYFASSSGFDMKTDVYLRTLNTKIAKEKNLDKWAGDVIKNSKTLNYLKYEEIKEELLSRLKILPITPIVPTDIQSLLSVNESIVVPVFFTVRMVTDNKPINELKESVDEIKEQIKLKSIKPEKILEEFTDESVFLANYKSTFSLNNPLPIARKITGKISDWIKTPLKEKEESIAIVKGGAGSGKTVILNNLYHSLLSDEIPTIAIKADIKSADSIIELEKKLNLSTSLETSIQTLLNIYEKVVIIVDQIDALSQTLSSNRNNLTTYISLVEKLKKIAGVRIIISVREYDLNYDPYLIPFKKNSSFEAGVLEEKELTEVLKALQVSNSTQTLLKLLSTPLHLELFCQIYNNQEKNDKFDTIYDLYTELWALKIASKGTKDRREELKNTLYKIASKIYDSQGSLSVKGSLFDIEDVNYLITEGLLIKINGTHELTFFHQTFYDYVFARQFVESEKNVIAYLKENSQGLFIRSCLKIILAHLREHNPKDYKNLIVELLINSTIRFHLKQLVLNYLGSIEDPNNAEKDIAETNIMGSNGETVFYESLNTVNWVKYGIESGWIDRYLSSNDAEKIDTVFDLLLRNKERATKEILTYFTTLPSSSHNDGIIARYLYFVNKWDHIATALYTRTKDIILKNPFSFCQCMKTALQHDEYWVYNEIKVMLLRRAENLGINNHKFSIDHSETELIKKLFKHNTEEAFYLIQNVIETIISKTKWESDNMGLKEDSTFFFFSSSSENHYGDDDEFYQVFVNAIEDFSRTKHPIFKELITKYAKSDSASILRFLIYGYLANPKFYYEEALSTLQYIHSVNGFVHNEKLEYFARQLVSAIYSFLSHKQKEELNLLLLSIKSEYETKVFIHHVTKEKTRPTYQGYRQYQFLVAVPANEIIQFRELNRKYQELNRKFGKISDREPNKVSISGVAAPYKKTSYEKMSLQDWENTFYKYTNDWKVDFSSHMGGIDEHSRVFEEQVILRPDFFFPLIEKIIDTDNISTDYKTHGINGLIAAIYDADKVLHLITKLISKRLNDINALYTIRNIDYLVKNKKVNDKVFDFLCEQATDHEDPQKDDLANPRQRSLNSVRGAALDRLMRFEDKKFADRLFAVVDKAVNSEKTFAVKATIIRNSAYLLNINQDKAFEVFVKMLKSDKRLIKEAMWAAGYFSNFYYSKMTFFFDPAMKSKKTFDSLANLLALAWLRGIAESEKYLFALLKKSNEARAEVVKIAVHPENLIEPDGSLDEKCVQLYKYSLNKTGKELVHQYSIAFLHFEPEMFEGLFPLLKDYSKSKIFRNSPAYFCQYLIKCCTKKTVYKCADLISHFDKLVKTNISQGNHYDNEPVNTVLAIYNVLGNTAKDKQLKEHCMNMFDKMLQQPQHRNAAQQATTLVEL